MKPKSAAFLVICLVLWSFSIWVWIYQQKIMVFEEEKNKAELLAEDLASVNAVPLQNQLEPLVTLNGLDRVPGVMGALVTDAQGKILAPINRFGEQSALGNQPLSIRIEKAILGLNKEILGNAVIVYHPRTPNFYSLWFIFFAPILLAAGLYYFQRRRLDNSRTAAEGTAPLDNSWPWISVLSRFLNEDLFVFDEQGNILASSDYEQPKHLLDLFPQTDRAQKILNLLQDLKDNNENLMESPELGKLQIGSWRSDNGTKRFLLAYHSCRHPLDA